MSDIDNIQDRTTLSIVYVLTNPAMPGLVKIGKTSADEAELRLRQLYGTGVPFPFRLEFACRVTNPDEVEKALHMAFAPNRVNPRREFFQIDSSQAIAILKLLHTEETTETVAISLSDNDVSDAAAGEAYRKRRPNLNFDELGIPIGSVLECISADASAVVISPKKVRYDNDDMSLTAATKLALGLDYAIAPGPHWRFNGKLVRAIYDETYPYESD